MKISTFLPDDYGESNLLNSLYHYLKIELRKMGRTDYDFINYRCLCDYPETFVAEEGVDIVFAHPHRGVDDACLKKTKSAVEANPSVDFYIISLESKARTETIGDHPNITYITLNRITEVKKRLLMSLSKTKR